MRYSEQEDPQFQKIFEFERTHEWRLPQTAYSAPHFQIQELQDMKTELNRVKSKLNDFDLGEWSLHTKNSDVAGYVISQLRSRVKKPELLTQAWCKFFEIVSTFPIVQATETLRSLHLCEAPGAFICALNHYLVLSCPNIHWQWYANTLNPDYEGNLTSHMISDDRLICHTREHWLFGLDLSGDILQYYNHVDIVTQVTADKKVELVTADGSIDCMSDPGEQEKLVEYLHYCETMTALAVLDKGGSFVLKIFTIFEESTVCLLYLLNCVFDKTYLFKPCTSKSGNSELYLACVGFNGHKVLTTIWPFLLTPYKNGLFDGNCSMFSVDDIPNSFKVQIKSCCADFFLEKQISTINYNIYYYLNPDKAEKMYLHHRKVQIANRYIKRYQLKTIPKDCRVVPHLDVHFRKYDFYEPKRVQSISLKDRPLFKFVKITLGKRIDNVCTSNFATAECISDLLHSIDKPVKLNSLYNLASKALDDTTLVFNVNQFSLSPYYKFQRNLLDSLRIALDIQKHIIFLNVPFHTSFLAAVWSILATGFVSVYYGSGWCLFYQPVKTSIHNVKNIIDSVLNTRSNFYNGAFYVDVIYIFDPKVFCYELDFVPPILKLCNSFQIPTK